MMSNSKVTYRKQYTRCGKQRCRKCREGAGHGPYWYAYWSEKGRTISKYIGAQLPDNIESSKQAAGEGESTSSLHTAMSGTATPLLRIYVLGQFRIESQSEGEWRSIDSRTWHRRRARALLGCLLSSPGRRLGREQVIDQLWPDLDLDVAANRLHGAVHELRQILEPDIERPASSRLLRLERDMLELADSTSIWVDAEAFEKFLKEAHSINNPEQAESLLEEAEMLYHGSYLMEELYAEWATPRRDALQRSWVGLLLKLAHLRAERGASIRAIETLDKLRTAEPTNETALQHLMILLTQLDRRGEALHAYQQHATMLQRDYENEPLPETRKLYEELRQGLHPTTHHFKEPGNKATREKGPASTPPPPPPAQQPQEITFSRPAFQLGRHNQSPLIGRSHEIETMSQILLAVEGNALKASITARKEASDGHTPLRLPLVATRAKHPHFILLKGETGIGKTRLAEELSLNAYTRGWAVAWSRSYEQESAIPYRPWVELLRTLFHETSAFADLTSANSPSQTLHISSLKLERLSALLPELTFHPTASISKVTTAHEPQERLHLWEATLGLLSMLSKIHPLLLILDDLHWADDSSIELLTYLTHHLHDQPVLLIGTCRDGELTPQHKLSALITDLRREQTIVTVAVKPLTNSQISTLLSHLPRKIVQSIQTQAAGNPFFAEELARYVGTQQSEDASLDTGEQPGTSAAPLHSLHSSPLPSTEREVSHNGRLLPEAIAAVLERRLHRLSSGCQALLGKAAVLGGAFELSQLLPMSSEQGEDVVLDLLEEALNAGLLTEEGTGAHITYHFWHPLIISHLYERLSATRRAQLHRKAAQAITLANANISQEKGAAAIVYHLSRGGGDPASVSHYAELAGNQAYALAAYSEALQYYLQVLQTITGTEMANAEQGDILAHLMQLTPHALEKLSLIDPQHICRLLEQVADCSIILGNFQSARRSYECILHLHTSEVFQRQLTPASSNSEEMHRHEAQIQALLWREIGNTWAAVSEYDHAYACYEQGTQVMRQAGVTSGAAWACLRLQYGEMLRQEGRYQEARSSLEEALEMLEYAVQQQSYSYSIQNGDRQDLQLSRRKNGLTRTELALRGDPLEIGYAHERLGVVEASVGQLSQALQHLHIALSIYEQCDLVTVMIRVCGNLGAVYILQGDLKSARTYLHRSHALSERSGNLPVMACSMDNLGEVAHRSGDLLDAEVFIKQSLALTERVSALEHSNGFTIDLAAVQIDLGKLNEARRSVLSALIIGRRIKNPRSIRFALLRLGELRLIEAIQNCQWPSLEETTQRSPSCQRLLVRARATLQKAISGEGMERDYILEGKRLLAIIYLMQNEVEKARGLALQVLQEAQAQEGIRIIGRAYSLLGSIMATNKNYAEADHFFKQAIQLFRTYELKLDYARTLHNYGLTLAQRGRLSPGEQAEMIQREGLQGNATFYQRGLDNLQEARTIFAACHAALDLKQAEKLLARIEAYIAPMQAEHMLISVEQYRRGVSHG